MRSRKELFHSVYLPKIILLLVDVLLVNISMFFSFEMLFDFPSMDIFLSNYVATFWLLSLCFCASLIAFKVYNILWRYASSLDIVRVFSASAVGTVLYYVFSILLKREYPIQIYIILCLISALMILFSRFLYRLLKLSGNRNDAEKNESSARIMIVGGGNAGSALVHDLLVEGKRRGTPVVVVDDDLEKHHTSIKGIPVLYGIDNIQELVKRFNVDEIYIAVPSATADQYERIISNCTKTSCVLKTVPPLSEVKDFSKPANMVRTLRISDLLLRDEVTLDTESISGYIKDKTVLVTGGGGSIGSELCRQIAKFSPSLLVIFDIYENNAYELQNELHDLYGDALNTRIVIGSIRDMRRLEEVFEEFKPELVFHAAAHKHVPLMEDSPAEAVKNNVFGTWNVAQCADRYHVDRFVLLSTDKAVNPTNVMGATKRVTEMIIRYMSTISKTKYMAVRFGNVLGSNGSVVPLFKKQIEMGGPVRVTHPDITRYFMTIPEAAQLVLQAGGMAESGSIYVLDMGSPVKIDDLARNMIRLMGYRPDVDIMVNYTGLRPGEKLYEELILSDEKDRLITTAHNRIMVTHPVPNEADQLLQKLDDLKAAIERDSSLAVEYLKLIVPIQAQEKANAPKKAHPDEK